MACLQVPVSAQLELPAAPQLCLILQCLVPSFYLEIIKYLAETLKDFYLYFFLRGRAAKLTYKL